MELSIKSFDQICRACLCTSNNMKSLFTKIEGDGQNLLDLFVLVANLDASTEDEMPKQVCGECELILYKHNEFRKRCIISDDLLKKVLSDTIQFDAITTETCSDADFELQDFEKKEFGESNESFLSNDAIKHNSVKTEFYENGQDLDHFDNPEALEMLPIQNEKTTTQLKTKNTQKKSRSMKSHKITEIKDTVKYEFSCQLCNINFINRETYENHLETHKYMTVKRKTQEEQSKTREELSNQCSLCFRRCKTKKTLSKHMKLHEKNDNIKYSCDRCKREFKYKSFLENHIISVHMRNGYECHLCKQTFKSKESLEVHMDRHTAKKHVCSVCGKAYKMLCTLKDHMRKHTGEKPFLCCTCGKGFSQKTNLAQHTRRHLGVKPFKCAICAKCFVSKGELEAHTRKHSGAHPFVCDDCGSGFTTSSALLKHRRTHTGERPYACDLCPMRFAASGTLTNHRRTHTGERPFQCSLCEKAFVQRTDLITHIRCHTGERPYVCSECGQAFRKSAALKTHLKMHGKEMAVMPMIGMGHS